jgi:hypothetical protein
MSISYYKLRLGESAIFDCYDLEPYEILESDGNWKRVSFLNETARFVVPMFHEKTSRLNNLEVFKATHCKDYPYDLQICLRGENEIGAFRRRIK